MRCGGRGDGMMELGFLNQLTENPDYLEEIGPNFWLMDDHRWALHVWERLRSTGTQAPYILVHLDFHYDGVNDFAEEEDRKRLLSATSTDMHTLVKENELVKLDSFIAPAVLRNVINEIHFFCLQSEEETEPGIDSDIAAQSNCKQFFYTSVTDLAAAVKDKPVLFDLCLDLFNKEHIKHGEGILWEESDIIQVIDACKPLIRNAIAVTTSLSFGYSGTAEQTRQLAKIVIPKCLSYRYT